MVVAVYWYTGESACVQFLLPLRIALSRLAFIGSMTSFSTFAASFFQKLFICLSVRGSYVTTCHVYYDLRVAGVCYAFLLSGLSIGCLVSIVYSAAISAACISAYEIPNTNHVNIVLWANLDLQRPASPTCSTSNPVHSHRNLLWRF